MQEINTQNKEWNEEMPLDVFAQMLVQEVKKLREEVSACKSRILAVNETVRKEKEASAKLKKENASLQEKIKNITAETAKGVTNSQQYQGLKKRYDRQNKLLTHSQKTVSELTAKLYQMGYSPDCGEQNYRLSHIIRCAELSKTKIYVAGPFTGAPECKIRFLSAKKEIQSIGYKNVVVPMDICDNTWGYWKCLVRCLLEIEGSDRVIFLKDWEHSPGAKIEHAVAKLLGKEIIEENNNEK